MENEPDAHPTKILLPAIVVSLVLFGGVYIAYQSAKSRPSTIVLPGGITYLGPTPTSPTTSVAEYKGKVYPYSFQYPSTFSLGWFPNDQYDAVTAFLPNTDSNTNIFFRIEKLNGAPMDYAQKWWKQYSWKGVASVTAFTNSNGLKGYRAKYLDQSGKTPFDHVFFEVPARNASASVAGGPGKDDLIIWISGKLFTQDVFDKLIDSVSWSQ